MGPLTKAESHLGPEARPPGSTGRLRLLSPESTDVQVEHASLLLPLPGHWFPGLLIAAHSWPFESFRGSVSNTDSISDPTSGIQPENAGADSIPGVLF